MAMMQRLWVFDSGDGHLGLLTAVTWQFGVADGGDVAVAGH